MSQKFENFKHLRDDFDERIKNIERSLILTKKNIKDIYRENPYNGRDLTVDEFEHIYKYYGIKIRVTIAKYEPKITISEELITSFKKNIKETIDELYEKDKIGPDRPFAHNFAKVSKSMFVNVCYICSNKSKHVCSICNKTKYCSKKCQKYDWSDHKKICQPAKL